MFIRFDSNELPQFDDLLCLADQELKQNPDALNVVVLQTVNGDIVTALLRDATDDDFVCAIAQQSEKVITALKEQGSPVISVILTLFRGNTPDLPSFALRQALIELNPENTQAMILLGPSIGRTIASTMPG